MHYRKTLTLSLSHKYFFSTNYILLQSSSFLVNLFFSTKFAVATSIYNFHDSPPRLYHCCHVDSYHTLLYLVGSKLY